MNVRELLKTIVSSDASLDAEVTVRILFDRVTLDVPIKAVRGDVLIVEFDPAKFAPRGPDE